VVISSMLICAPKKPIGVGEARRGSQRCHYVVNGIEDASWRTFKKYFRGETPVAIIGLVRMQVTLALWLSIKFKKYSERTLISLATVVQLKSK
jgi:hypothetical protein